tara:strand:- start:1027 stop:1830 length:804 start_codon:yes stop_codon:yes gene_type:complete
MVKHINLTSKLETLNKKKKNYEIDREFKLKKAEEKHRENINYLTSRYNNLINNTEDEIRLLNDDKLDDPVSSLGYIFYYKTALEAHKKTDKYRITTDEPYILCKLTRKIFFGMNEETYKKLLLSNPQKALDTEYHKHRRSIKTECDECGFEYTNHLNFNKHKCNILLKKVKQNIKPKFIVKKKVVEKEVEKVVEVESDLESDLESEIESEVDSDEELTEWSYNHKKHYVSKCGIVFDNYSEEVGYRWNDKLIQSDDEFFEDYLEYYE